MNRTRNITRENPACDERQRCMGHNRVLEKQISVFQGQTEQPMGQLVKKVVSEDKKIATEGHRRGITSNGKHCVIQPVPVTDEGIDKVEDQDGAD